MFNIIGAAVLAAGLIGAPMAAIAQTKPATPTAAPEQKQAKTTKKPPTRGQTAARERTHKCAAEWKEAKAAGKIEKGTT